MPIQKSSTVTLSTTEQRQKMAAAADTVQKTPDYHLPWTGPVVESAIEKAMNLDPTSIGGVLVLPSSADQPANFDQVLDAGMYTAKYGTATQIPESISKVTPLSLTVSVKDGILYQEIEGLGDKFTRFSTTNGESWSVWSPKPTNSGGIGTETPEKPAKDPIVDLTNRVDALETVTSGGAGIGTAEMATKMLNKEFDYDAPLA